MFSAAAMPPASRAGSNLPGGPLAVALLTSHLLGRFLHPSGILGPASGRESLS
jgi:hypothetical protein